MKNKVKYIYNYIKDMDVSSYGYITIITILPLMIVQIIGRSTKYHFQILIIKLSISILGTLTYILLFGIWRHKMTRKEKINMLLLSIGTIMVYYGYLSRSMRWMKIMESILYLNNFNNRSDQKMTLDLRFRILNAT